MMRDHAKAPIVRKSDRPESNSCCAARILKNRMAKEVILCGCSPYKMAGVWPK